MPVPRAVIDDFLAQRSLALVGVSRDGKRASATPCARSSSGKGYTLHVVHPEADRIGDQPCAHTLADVAGEVGGVVLVTPPEQTLKLVARPRRWACGACGCSKGPSRPRPSPLRGAWPLGRAWRVHLDVRRADGLVHRAHRWARGVFGELPEGEPARGRRARRVARAPALAARKRDAREVAGLGLDPSPRRRELVTQADLEALPPVVQRYLRFMGVIGRPRARSLMMRFSGSFLFGGEWVPCECAQYDSRLPVARIFHMRLRVKGIVPTYVRDTYLRGRGHMVGKALGALTVVDDESEPTTIGECVTYLNDAILMAPSLLLGPEVEWTAQGEGAFDVALTDAGRTVRARVFVDEAGRVTDFSTTDRFYSPPGSKGPPTRAEWRTPVDGWQEHEGRVLPTSASAVWMLASGPLAYAKFPFDPRSFAPNPSVESAGG
jgi:hypothetical protein